MTEKVMEMNKLIKVYRKVMDISSHFFVLLLNHILGKKLLFVSAIIYTIILFLSEVMEISKTYRLCEYDLFFLILD